MDFLDSQSTGMLKNAVLDMRKKIKRLEAEHDELNEKCACLQKEVERLRATIGETSLVQNEKKRKADDVKVPQDNFAVAARTPGACSVGDAERDAKKSNASSSAPQPAKRTRTATAPHTPKALAGRDAVASPEEVLGGDTSGDHTHALVVFISACLVDAAIKLHAAGSAEHEAALRVALDPGVRALRDDPVFQAHHRCEPNYGLDSGALACLEKALPCEELARAKIGLVKAIICPQDGMLDALEGKYRELTGKTPWDDDVCPEQLFEALRPIKLDDAYGGMRRSFFEAEARRQLRFPGALSLPNTEEKSAEGGKWQKTLFANYYSHLCETRAFQSALEQFAVAGGATKLQPVLEETLAVKTKFHRMLVAREYSFLLETFPDNAGELLVNVGGGAAKTVRECARKEYMEKKTYPQTELLADLRLLHASVLAGLDKDLLKAVCPKGWMLDHTEHASCEKRRLDDAQVRAKEGKSPKRTRDAEAAAERQRIRCRRIRSGPPGQECWRALGFKIVPSRVE